MKIAFVSLCAACIFFSCSKNENNTSTSASGQTDFSVYLSDDPSVYDAVNIDIESVEVHYSDDNSDGWHSIQMIHPGVHNLLKLANGKDTLLATQRIASKKITQMRFILGDDNTVVVNGITYSLKTPSAQESGLKFDVDATLTAGIEYKIWTDFDAQRSIVVTGNNEYLLKPVIRVFTKALTGSISGVVLPHEAAAFVYVLNGSDTIASAMPDPVTGMFMINGLAAGNYTVAVDGNNGYADATYNNINVSIGNVTATGTTTLHQ
jgi:hypothetical protein